MYEDDRNWGKSRLRSGHLLYRIQCRQLVVGNCICLQSTNSPHIDEVDMGKIINAIMQKKNNDSSAQMPLLSEGSSRPTDVLYSMYMIVLTRVLYNTFYSTSALYSALYTKSVRTETLTC